MNGHNRNLKDSMRAVSWMVACAVCAACSGSTTDPEPVRTVYTGTFSVALAATTESTSLTGGGTQTCTNSFVLSGTATATLTDEGAGVLRGPLSVSGTEKENGVSGSKDCPLKGDSSINWELDLTGSASDIRGSTSRSETKAGFTMTKSLAFVGSVANGLLLGTLSFGESGSGNNGNTTSITQTASATTNTTLR